MASRRASGRRPPERFVSALKPVDFHVLLALRHGERHGYRLVQDIAEQSRGRIRLAPASLYTVLQRLLDWGFLEEADESDSASGGPPRRVYRLSIEGGRALEAEAQRLRELLAELDAPGAQAPEATR